MHDAGGILEAPGRRVVVAARVKPHVALRICGRKRWSGAEGCGWRITFGRADSVKAGVCRDCAVVGVVDRTCLGEAQLRTPEGRFGERQIGEARDVIECGPRRVRLEGAESLESVDLSVARIFARTGREGERDIGE